MWKQFSSIIILQSLIFVEGHGCFRFNISNDLIREAFLVNDMVPEPIKDFVGESNSSTIYGIYDCHDSIDEYEVGVSAAVIDDGITVEGSTGGVSTCTALYNFEECQSCTLDCGADLANLDINSFKADCSNVVLENPVEGACMVDCGYQTSGCFPSGSSSGSRITGVTAATLSLMLAGAFFYH